MPAASKILQWKVKNNEMPVRNYLPKANRKLVAGNRVEAARIARQKGWLQEDDPAMTSGICS